MNIKESLTYKAISNLEKLKFRSMEDFAHYVFLLTDTGNLDLAHQELQNVVNFSQIYQGSMSPNLLRLTRFFKKLPSTSALKDVEKLEQMCHYILTYHLVDHNVSDHFIERILPNISVEKCTYTENLILAFIVNKIISKSLLTEKNAIHLIKFFCFCRRRHNIRSDYMVILITEYALKQQFIGFFKLGTRYNHLQNILARIYNCQLFLNEEEKKLFSQQVLNRTYLHNDLSTPSLPKIAICISGIYRGHEASLQSIKRLADELNADIYMHTWDQTADWPGIGGTPSFIRLFGKENELKITAEFRGLNNILKIKNIFPLIYQAIEKPIYSSTRIADIERILGKSAQILIENQEQVVSTLVGDSHDFNGRGGLNQFKMFYGIKSSLEMAVNSGMKYDYILRLRPDVMVESNQINLKNLQKNTFYGLIERVVGFTDLEFLISIEMTYSFISMVQDMIDIKRLSPYKNLPKYDSHLLIFTWILHTKCQVAPDLLVRNLMDSSHFKDFPKIGQALEKDLCNLPQDKISHYSEFIKFIVDHCNLDEIFFHPCIDQLEPSSTS